MKWIALFLLNSVIWGLGPLDVWIVWHHCGMWALIAWLPSAPVMMLMALPFVRNDPANVLPPVLQFLNTTDDPGANQGMYEPQVKWWNDHWGWLLKTWYWLGVRNQCYGLFAYLCTKYDGSPVVESTWGGVKIYAAQGHEEITWAGRRVSFGYKVQTLKTAKIGDTIWWVFMPAFWKTREY